MKTDKLGSSRRSSEQRSQKHLLFDYSWMHSNITDDIYFNQSINHYLTQALGP